MDDFSEDLFEAIIFVMAISIILFVATIRK